MYQTWKDLRVVQLLSSKDFKRPKQEPSRHVKSVKPSRNGTESVSAIGDQLDGKTHVSGSQDNGVTEGLSPISEGNESLESLSAYLAHDSAEHQEMLEHVREMLNVPLEELPADETHAGPIASINERMPLSYLAVPELEDVCEAPPPKYREDLLPDEGEISFDYSQVVNMDESFWAMEHEDILVFKVSNRQVKSKVVLVV